MPNSTKRIDLQVLRGISVTSVFLYHLNSQIFPNGFLGVDIFFLISGFLVCNQLNTILGESTHRDQTRELIGYFKRRLLRILPALSIFLIFAMLFTTLFFDSASSSQFMHLKHSIQAIFNIYNLDLLKHSTDYFKSEDPLLNLWSLSVEVQTYLIFTLLSLLTLRAAISGSKRQKNFKNYIIISIIASALLSVAVLKYSSYFQRLGLENLANAPSFINFYSPLSRLWEFGLGGLIGFHSTQLNQLGRPNIKSLKNIGLVLLASTLLVDIPCNRSVILLLVIIVTLYFLSSADYSRRNRTLDYLEWIGNRSYSIYLYHLVCITLINRIFRIDTWIESIFMAASAGSLSILLGNISYKFVEQRFNSRFKGTRRTNNTPMKLIGVFVSLGSLGTLTIFCVGLVLPSPNQSADWNINYAASPTKACPLEHKERPCKLVNGFSSNWLLVGDSHAGALQIALAKVARKQNTNLFTWNQCIFFDPELLRENRKFFPEWCVKLNKARKIYLKKEQISALFVAYQYSPPTFGDSRMSDSSYEKLISKSIERVPYKIPVFEFSQVPEFRDPIRLNSRLGYKIQVKDSYPYLSNADIFKQRKLVRNRENFKWIDLSSAFCSNGICVRYKGGWLYVDDNHLSIRGANQTIPLISAAVEMK